MSNLVRGRSAGRTVTFDGERWEWGKYQLGAVLLHIGSSYLDASELRTRALSWADSLATHSGESVRIGTLHEHHVLIVHHVFRRDSRQALEVGSLVPAHATALGKVLLAHHVYVLATLGAGPLPSYTPATVTDLGRLHAELEMVLERGWAGEVGELFTGVASIAAAIQDRRGAVVGAIDIAGPIERLCESTVPRADLAGHVMETARTVSRELGAVPW